ncbi:YraN family protein [Leifsonia sp. NPDC058248]|uniref:YraN family protein n=1 Tax=Leifsonia sp. NPDC058248 TaxID=3346402 RepID=UPI0036DCCB3F
MAAKDDLGRRGEDVAARWFERHGYAVIDRNWRCRAGELDLVVRREETTVFVEVKTRTSVAYGHPFEAITTAKTARLRRLAGEWCAEQNGGFAQLRIDAVAVIDAWSDTPQIEHLMDIA